MRIDNSQTTVSRTPDITGVAMRTTEGREGPGDETKAELAVSNKTGAAAQEKEYIEKKTLEEQADELLKKSNSTIESKYVRFEFSVHEATNKVMVKVVDKATDELIREIPPEKILDMVAKMWELAGLFIDKKI